MKKISTSLLAICFLTICFGQTNKLESTGNVGIGTDSPSSLFEINSSGGTITSDGSGISFNRINNSCGVWLRLGNNGIGHWVMKNGLAGCGNIGDLNFINSNQSHVFTLKQSGKVGIGVTNPDMKLDVRSNERYITRFHHSGSNTISGIRTGRSSSYGDIVNLSNGFGIGVGSTSSSLPLSSQNVNHIDFFIDKSSGNVGIGTTNPGVFNTNSSYQIYNSSDRILDIQGDTHMGWVSVGSNISDGVIGGLSFTKPNGQAGGHRQVAYIRTSISPSNNGHAKSTLEFGTKGGGGLGGPKMIINESGNVGIGTTTPQSKLAVNGQIRATEVKVLADISVPDYVFESDYDLRTLQETKEYIAENKHLPEIPSAAEIGENGIDLGDMNMKLLKKIEELTLYQIELMEEMKEMKKELKALKD